MYFRSILLALGACVFILFISCETQWSENEHDHQHSTLNANQGALMDTSNMEKIDGVPVMSAPGSQIEKSQVEAVLDESNLSFREIAPPRGTVEEIENSTEKLKMLLNSELVRNDKELQFIVHNMLGNSYLRLYERSEQSVDLDRAKEHFDLAISLFENQQKYKADLAEPYSGRIGIFISEKKYDKAIAEMKYLIEEYQEIGFGPYKNWFASHQVGWLHSLTGGDSLESSKKRELMDYLSEVSDKYNNEVGITAQITLARHYLKNDDQSRVKVLSKSIENRLPSLNNPSFKQDKWEPLKKQMKRMENKDKEQNN